MGNHTKGPWHRNVPPATKYTTIFAGRNTHIARVVTDGGLTPEEVEANCELIAAAPELLNALRARSLTRTAVDGPSRGLFVRAWINGRILVTQQSVAKESEQ